MSDMTLNAIMPTYRRAPLAFAKGEGAWLMTQDGTPYLDFAAGVAVNVLGYRHPALVAALRAQADNIWHISNLYTVPQQQHLAAKLSELTFAEQVFFCNSGAEAVEGAIKTARKYHASKGNENRYEIITFQGAFHGRTLTALAAAGNEAHLAGYGPVAPGFIHIDGFDLDKVEAAIGTATAGILIEPIQGEGGIVCVADDFLIGLRRLCDTHGLLLILDEVQSGMGRTGKLFAHEWAQIRPDIMAVAKGLGGGFPIGAVLANKEAACGMTVGSHGSTYGGNLLAMAVGATVLDIVADADFLAHVAQTAQALRARLDELAGAYGDIIQAIHGRGLMLGVQCVGSHMDFMVALRDAHMLTVAASNSVIRLLPPLIIGEKEIAAAYTALQTACDSLRAKQAK